MITNEAEAVMEEGTAVEGENAWWTYITRADLAGMRGNPKVLVSAKDLPGHTTQMTKSLSQN